MSGISQIVVILFTFTLAVRQLAGAEVIGDVNGPSSGQEGCVGSAKLLDYQGAVLATFSGRGAEDGLGMLRYQGEVSTIRLEGNCCFRAKERRGTGRGKVLREWRKCWGRCLVQGKVLW